MQPSSGAMQEGFQGMTVQHLLEAHIRNVQLELASQREMVRLVQQQLSQQLHHRQLEGGLAWGARLSC